MRHTLPGRRERGGGGGFEARHRVGTQFPTSKAGYKSLWASGASIPREGQNSDAHPTKNTSPEPAGMPHHLPVERLIPFPAGSHSGTSASSWPLFPWVLTECWTCLRVFAHTIPTLACSLDAMASSKVTVHTPVLCFRQGAQHFASYIPRNLLAPLHVC